MGFFFSLVSVLPLFSGSTELSLSLSLSELTISAVSEHKSRRPELGNDIYSGQALGSDVSGDSDAEAGLR